MMNILVDYFFLTYFLAIVLTTSVLVGLALREIRRRKSTDLIELDEAVLTETSSPPIGIIVPAYNEELHIVSSVRGFLKLNYHDHEVVVVNDGSLDHTFKRLREAFDLRPTTRFVGRELKMGKIRGVYRSESDPRLWVVDKENGGKADALNAGINVTRAPLVCCVDADTILAPDALLRLVSPFLYEGGGVVAVGGTVRVVNGSQLQEGRVVKKSVPRSWLARFQIVEYLSAFLFGRMGFNRLGGNVIISGAAGLFLREAVIEAGGYQKETVGEDMELVVRLHRREYESGRKRRIIQLPGPIAFTEAPEDLATLARQRDRWHRGLTDTLWRHRKMLCNPRYGRIGMVVMPWFVVFKLIAPVIEIGGYFWLVWALMWGFLSYQVAVVFAAVALLWGISLALYSLLVDNESFNVYERPRDRLRLATAALFLNLGYRQFTVVCCLVGMVRHLFGIKSWGTMQRQGFEQARQVAS